MLMYQQFMPNQGEASILTIPGPEWRTNVDIAIDPKAIDPTGSTANQNLALALVRLYANQGSARSEIARGRVPHLNADNVTVPARRVIRARSEGADSYEVTIQAERGSLVMTGISPQPVVTAMLWGEEGGSQASDPITVFAGVPAVNDGLVVSFIPTHLHSFTTGGSNTTRDVWIFFFDLGGGASPAPGARSALPPLYLSAGGKANVGYDFDKRPFIFQNGLVIAASSTPATFTAAATGDGPQMTAEYV